MGFIGKAKLRPVFEESDFSKEIKTIGFGETFLERVIFFTRIPTQKKIKVIGIVSIRKLVGIHFIIFD